MTEMRGWWSLGGQLDENHDPVPRPAWFERLVRLMIDGVGEDRVSGTVHVRVDDDGGTDFDYRLFRRGDLFRLESLAGAVHIVAGRDQVWERLDGRPGELRVAARDVRVGTPDDYDFGTHRYDENRWDGDDFTVPTGPPQEITFLGRPAVRIELAPPPHKLAPMYIVLDAGSGLPLEQGNETFGTFARWTALDVGLDLPDDLFVWRAHDRLADRYE